MVPVIKGSLITELTLALTPIPEPKLTQDLLVEANRQNREIFNGAQKYFETHYPKYCQSKIKLSGHLETLKDSNASFTTITSLNKSTVVQKKITALKEMDHFFCTAYWDYVKVKLTLQHFVEQLAKSQDNIAPPLRNPKNMSKLEKDHLTFNQEVLELDKTAKARSSQVQNMWGTARDLYNSTKTLLSDTYTQTGLFHQTVENNGVPLTGIWYVASRYNIPKPEPLKTESSPTENVQEDFSAALKEETEKTEPEKEHDQNSDPTLPLSPNTPKDSHNLECWLSEDQSPRTFSHSKSNDSIAV